MTKLENILYQSWESGRRDDWENRLISMGCGFIRTVRITNHLGWANPPPKREGFVLVEHPMYAGICDRRHTDFCLIPQDLALKISALEYLPI